MALCHPRCQTPPSILDFDERMGGTWTPTGQMTLNLCIIEGPISCVFYRGPLFDRVLYHQHVVSLGMVYDQHRHVSVPDGFPSIGLCTGYIPCRQKDTNICLPFTYVVHLRHCPHHSGSINHSCPAISLCDYFVYRLCCSYTLLNNVFVLFNVYKKIAFSLSVLPLVPVRINILIYVTLLLKMLVICFVWVIKMTPHNLFNLVITEMVVLFRYVIFSQTLSVNTMVFHLILYINSLCFSCSNNLSALITNIHSSPSRARTIYRGFVGLSHTGSVEILLSHLNADRL